MAGPSAIHIASVQTTEAHSHGTSRLHWKLIGFACFGIAALVTMELISRGIDPESLRLVLRTTARTSALLFALGFATPFLRRGRVYSDSLLICFAASQAVHLIAIVWLVNLRHTQRALIDPPGLLAYTCIAVVLFRIIGDRLGRWVTTRLRKLETVALYIFWLIITGAFAGLFPGIKLTVLHAVIVVGLVASLVVRLMTGKGFNLSGLETSIGR